MAELTFCEDCDNSSTDNISRPSWRWLCLAHPRKSGTGFVTRDYWDKDEPYFRCADINRVGQCADFKEK